MLWQFPSLKNRALSRSNDSVTLLWANNEWLIVQSTAENNERWPSIGKACWKTKRKWLCKRMLAFNQNSTNLLRKRKGIKHSQSTEADCILNRLRWAQCIYLARLSILNHESLQRRWKTLAHYIWDDALQTRFSSFHLPINSKTSFLSNTCTHSSSKLWMVLFPSVFLIN